MREIIDIAYKQAKEILTTNMEYLHAMAAALLKYETIEPAQIEEIMDGQEPGPPAGWGKEGKKKKAKAKKRKRAAADIGKPAEQH